MKSAVLATENTKASKVRLGDLISEAKPIRCNNRDLPVLSMTMKDGLVLQSEKFKKRVASEDVSNYKVVSSNQLVVSFPIDEGVLAVQQIVEEGIVSPAYAIWNIDEDKVIPKYLESYLRSPSSLHYYKSKLRGTTVRRRSIPKSDFLAMELVLPTLKNQEMAIQELDLITELIRNREAQLARLDTLVKAKFAEMFGDLAFDKKWPMSKLVDACECADDIKCGPFGTQLGKDEYCNTGIAVWEIPQINTQCQEFPSRFVSEAKARDLEDYSVVAGDIVMSRKGNVGKCALFPEKWPLGIIHSDVIRIRVDKERIVPIFIMSQLHYSRDVQRQIELVSSGAVMAGINVTKLKNIVVQVPPLSLQKEFAAVVEEVDKSKAAITKTIENLKTLYKARLQEYFA